MFLELLEIIFIDIMNYKNESEVIYKEHEDLIEELSNKLDNVQEKLNTIMLFKGCAMLNANVKLLLDSSSVTLVKSLGDVEIS